MNATKHLSDHEIATLHTLFGLESLHFRTNRVLCRDWLAILLMLEAGLRVGELVRLKADDVLLGGKLRDRIIVRAEYTKTQTQRILPITARIAETLMTYSTYYVRTMEEFKSDYLICRNHSDTPLTVRAIQLMIGRRFRSYIGRSIHPHVLRHTFASCSLRYSDLKTVQALLGHSSITSTNVYLHSDPLRMKTAVDNAFKSGNYKFERGTQ